MTSPALNPSSSQPADSTPAPTRTNHAVEWLVAVFAIYLPSRYLWPLGANYYWDWYNHQWMVGYFGEYFRRHLTLPLVFNTSLWNGMAVPVFYGNLLYPLLALPASVFKAGIVIRLAALLIFVIQYRLLVQALSRAGAPRWSARLVACLVIWATYPLTNLYNRSALTEFFATSLLVCALSLAVLLFYAPSRQLERRYANWMMLCLVIAAGTHPITALFGIPFFCVIGVLFGLKLGEDPERRRSIARALVPGCLGSLACLAPWMYATAKYGEHLVIRYSMPIVAVWSDSLDNWVTRFYPIPFDGRVRPGIPLDAIPTPYLDSQVNMPLLVFYLAIAIAAVVFCRNVLRKGRLAVALVIPIILFAFFAWISLSPGSYEYLPNVARMIQWAYRAVTYLNLSLLLGVFLLLMALRTSSDAGATRILRHPVIGIIAVACLMLSAYGVKIKWTHVRAVRSGRGTALFTTEGERQTLIQLPFQYYGTRDYATPERFVPSTNEEVKTMVPVVFEVDSREEFGTVKPAQISLDKTQWVQTNVQAFPWNQLKIDGQDVPQTEIRVYDGLGLAMRVPAGSHRLAFEFNPDRLWRILRTISLLTLFSWIIASMVSPFVRRR